MDTYWQPPETEMRVKELGRVIPMYPADVKFHPFVGEKYRDSHYGVLLLVLGESHYCEEDRQLPISPRT